MKRGKDALALGAVLAAAALLRWGGLALVHDRGDALIWAGLAEHVSESGLEGYTIRRVDLGVQPIASGVVLYHFRAGRDGTGSLLEGFERAGEGYWDAPLANQPPAFTCLLLASHALLGERGDGFPLLGRGFKTTGSYEEQVAREESLVRAIARDPPRGAVRAQLWATLPVLLSDLATVALVFLLARSLGGTTRAALLAAAIFACDPLALYAAHRLLSNPTLATATTAAVLAFAAAEKDRRLAPLAGALAGLACLVKASAVFLLPAGWRRPSFWLVGALVFAPWAYLNWRLLGNPLGLAWQNQKDWLAVSEWGRLVTRRDAFFYARVLARSPLVAVGLLASVEWLRRGGARRFAAIFVLLVLAAAHFHSGGKEGRHILHVYPLLAVAASEWLERARRRLGDPALVLLVAAILVLDARAGLAAAYSTGAVPP